jgi:uncharacterized membrane protein
MQLERIHPAIVHFPIVFVITLFVVDLAAALRARSLSAGTSWGNPSALLAGAAGVFAFLAFLFGDQAYDIALAAGTPEGLLESHEGLGTFTAFAVLGWAVLRAIAWWRRVDLGGNRAWGVVAADAVLVGCIVTTAWLGGGLVFDHGIAVAKAVTG